MSSDNANYQKNVLRNDFTGATFYLCKQAYDQAYVHIAQDLRSQVQLWLDIDRRVNENLSDYISKFPTLEKFLGDWVKKELSRGEQDHCLLYYLNKGEPDWKKIQSLLREKMDVVTCVIVSELQMHHNHLKNLENHLTILNNEPQLSKYLEHLKEPSNFWQGYSEIETAALFKRHFGRIQLEPCLPNCNCVDFAFPFDGKSIYAEVNTPKIGQKFLEVLVKHSVGTGETPKAYRLPDSSDRVKDIILREFEHFHGANVPSLIIYNLNKSEFNVKMSQTDSSAQHMPKY